MNKTIEFAKTWTSRIAILSYFAIGLLQWTAIYSFFSGHLGWWMIFAFPIALFVAYAPVIGTIVGIYGAHMALGWDLTNAILLFLSPLLFYLAAFIFTFVKITVEEKTRSKKDAA